MPQYEFRASDGVTVFRFYKMSDRIPASIRLAGKRYHRQISIGSTRAIVKAGGEVKYAGVPYSRSLPKTKERGEVVNRFGQQVRKLRNGHYATMAGHRIVDSTAARQAHLGETGLVDD